MAQEIDLPVGVVGSAGLREFVQTRSITVSTDTKLSKDVERELLVLSDKARNGDDLSPSFDSAGAALDWLHSDKD